MAKLVAHEVEPRLAAQSEGEEANHLVQGNATVNCHRRRVDTHGIVHFAAYQSERNGLVAHQGLVVAFGIGHRLGLRLVVGHGEEEVVHAPLFLRLVFQHLDPKIRLTHAQAIIETHATVGNRVANARHSAHILRDSDGVRINFVTKRVGQLQVSDRIGIHVAVEIFPWVVDDETVAVVEIEH